MHKINQTFDNLLNIIQSIIMSFLVRLGPFAVALMPALFTGYAIYHTFKADAGREAALFFAVVVGLAMETVGIVATHTAIDLYNGQKAGHIEPVKFKLMAWLVPVYVIGVALVVAFSEEAFTPLVKGLGIASPFLTAIVYIAVALHRDLASIEAKQERMEQKDNQIDAEDRRWQREKEKMELQLKHQEKLARIEAKKIRNAPENPAQKGQNSPPLRVPKRDWRDQAAEIFAQNPDISGAELGRLIGASERTGQNILNELKDQQNKMKAGQNGHLNGKGAS